MTPRIAIAGLLAVSCLLAGPNLMMDAQTGWESTQATIVSFLGLGFAVLFSCLWARSIEDRNPRRFTRRRPF